MEAPEKIYISTLNDGDNHYYINKTDNLADRKYEVEYTRTDAFIEKVCKFLDDRIKHDSIDYPMATAHLIDDFKNYMKEK